MTLHDIALTDELFRGHVELEHTEQGVQPHRLPAWARRQLPDPQLRMAEPQPSGVRLVLRTNATAIELVTRPTRVSYVGAPDPSGSTACHRTTRRSRSGCRTTSSPASSPCAPTRT